MGFGTKCLPLVTAQCTHLECQLLASYRALLEAETLTSPHPLLFCIQVPIMPQDRDVSQQKISTATDVSFVKQKWYLQERVKPNLKGHPKLQEDVDSPMLSH